MRYLYRSRVRCEENGRSRASLQVNCAGILGNNQSSTNTSLPEFDRINDINYRGMWLCSRAELRAMLNQEPLPDPYADPKRPPTKAAIVNIASQLGIVGRPRASMLRIRSA